MAVIIRGNDAVFDAMQPANVSASMYDFVRASAERYSAAFGHVSSAVNTYVTEWKNQYANSDAARRATALMRQVKSYFTSDEIRPLRSIDELQNAPARMLRGVMAMPEARSLANRGMCNGYAGRYVDIFPTKQAEDHRDYKYVYCGRVVEGDEDSEYDYRYVTYGDDFVKDDDYEFLTVDQKDAIIDTRMLMYAAMAEDRDFTDPEDGLLR